jgi:hypothetical protein
MKDVAIVSFASSSFERAELDETEMLVQVIGQSLAEAGISKNEIGFTCSGSCDYLGGRPFSFVMALDAVGAWPPIRESHVEMDGAWALYEAWVRLQHGDIDAALVYAFGRATQGSLGDVLATQLDPYYVAPLWPDAASLAGLQACAAGTVDDVRAHRYADGASALVLASGDTARRLSKRPAWIRGIDHRIEAGSLGARDLSRSTSTEIAAKRAGAHARNVDVAHLHAVHAHQAKLLRNALALPEGVAVTTPESDPFIVTGLNCIGGAARAIQGGARSAIAHATSGPCLQQNLVCVLEA